MKRYETGRENLMNGRYASIGFLAAVGSRGAIAACAILCTVGLAFSQSHRESTILTFDAPGAGTGLYQGTIAYSIGPGGTIAGDYQDSSGVWHGLLRTPDGTIIERNQASCSQGYPGTSINPAGAMIGFCADANSVYHGILRAPDGAITRFDAPGAGASAGQGTFTAWPNGINPAGAITGDFLDANNVYHGFLRSPDGAITRFDAPGAGTGAFQGTLVSLFQPASSGGINDEGEITGTYVDGNNIVHGFLRPRDGVITTFDAPGAGTVTGSLPGTYPAGINAAGVIAGAYFDNGILGHGLLRARDGAFTAFQVPGAGLGPFQGTVALAINPEGTVTGNYVDANGAFHGYLRTPDGAITKFDVPGASTVAGEGTLPYSINAAGVIAGYYFDKNNVVHGFLRFP